MINPNGTSIHFKRTLHVPVETLFRAWADPQTMRAWWKELTVAEMDFRKGGRYRLTWSESDFVVGEYLEIQQNEKIVMSWQSHGDCGKGDVAQISPTSQITLNFKKISDKSCEFELRHDGIADEKQLDSHHWGWTHALYTLDECYERPQFEHQGSLEITRVLNAPVKQVFALWTNPDFVNRWFNRDGATAGKSSCDFRIKGNLVLDYQFKDGNVCRHYAQFTEISPERRLAFDWITDHCPYETKLVVEFKELGEKTELRLLHSGFRDEQMKKDHTEGWADCLRSMDREISLGL